MDSIACNSRCRGEKNLSVIDGQQDLEVSTSNLTEDNKHSEGNFFPFTPLADHRSSCVPMGHCERGRGPAVETLK